MGEDERRTLHKPSSPSSSVIFLLLLPSDREREKESGDREVSVEFLQPSASRAQQRTPVNTKEVSPPTDLQPLCGALVKVSVTSQSFGFHLPPYFGVDCWCGFMPWVL